MEPYYLRALTNLPLPPSPIPATPPPPAVSSPEEPRPAVSVYTDGSHIPDPESGEMRTGFAAYAQDGATYLAATSPDPAPPSFPLDPTEFDTYDGILPGTCFGSSPLCANSYSAEIMALIVGHLMVPTELDLTLHTDCQGALQVAQSFAKRTPLRKLKTHYHNLFRLFTYLQSTRPAKITWVRSHVGITENEIADRCAKAGALPRRTPLVLPQRDPEDQMPLQTLFDICKCPIDIAFLPRELDKVKPGMCYTTRERSHDPQELATPPGSPFHHLLHTYQHLANQAFAQTSTRGRERAQIEADPLIDTPLWHASIQGRILIPGQRTGDAFQLKLATPWPPYHHIGPVVACPPCPG